MHKIDKVKKFFHCVLINMDILSQLIMCRNAKYSISNS